MSEEAGAGTMDTAAEKVTSEPVQEQPRKTAGAVLREAREAAGLDLATLAANLKVSPKRLEALESDRLDLLPDAVFVRALSSSICRNLKLDPAPVLQLLPQTGAPRLQDDQVGLNTPFRSPTDVAKTPFWDRLSRPMVLAALAVLMAALVLIFMPSPQQRADLGAIVAQTAPSPALVQGTPVTPPVLVAPADKPKEKSLVVAEPVAAPAASKPVRTSPAPDAAASRAAVAPAAPAATVADETAPRRKLSSTGIVVFRTKEASWVEVTDGNGAIQLSRAIEPGQVVGASGPLPLSVTVGRADVTEVTVRGEPFSLDNVSKNGVARFEVK